MTKRKQRRLQRLEESKKKKEVEKEKKDKDWNNYFTSIGEATLKGLQNNDWGEKYWPKDHDMNDPYYYSSNIFNKYEDARFRFTLSSRPEGPVKLNNLNYKAPD